MGASVAVPGPQADQERSPIREQCPRTGADVLVGEPDGTVLVHGGGAVAGRITFPAIAETIEETLQRVPSREPKSVQEVLEIDRESREAARRVMKIQTEAVLGA